MSEFKCEIVKLKIETHPNADALEIARVGDYQSIVRKGQYKDGDLGVYIPEQAVLPQQLLKEMELWDEFKGKGKLAGTLGNRLKAIKLRGIVSQGLIYPVMHEDLDGIRSYWVEGGLRGMGMSDNLDLDQDNEIGTDVTEWLGVTKYEPKIPATMVGKILAADFDATARYDFENIKKNPSLFEEGEEVVITEKIHGTFLQIGVLPKRLAKEKYYKERVIISSKGQGAKGLVLDHNDETNLYAQTAKKHGLLDKLFDAWGIVADEFDKPIFLFGEVYGLTKSGAGIQDLKYDQEELGFRAFDACVGNRGNEVFFGHKHLLNTCDTLGIDTVPFLYAGPYSKETLLKFTDGKTTLKGDHIREGVVVKSADEIQHPRYGRKIAKSISDAYLLRAGEATEFN